MRTTWLTPPVAGVIGVVIGACAVSMLRESEPRLVSLSEPDALSIVEHQTTTASPACTDQEPVIPPAVSEHGVSDTSSPPSTPEIASSVPVEDEQAIDLAVREAKMIVHEALSRGEWTVDDGARLRERYRMLPDAQRTQLLIMLVVAVNRGELEPQSPRFPF